MSELSERLRAQITDDHVRGCMGRNYSCNCGYDADTEKLLEEGAAEIERLEHNQITADHTVIAQAAAIQAQEADAYKRYGNEQQQRAEMLDHKCSQFTNALLKSMTLIDELMRENVRLCAASSEPPNVRLFTAKNSFDAAMHKLLGDTKEEA